MQHGRIHRFSIQLNAILCTGIQHESNVTIVNADECFKIITYATLTYALCMNANVLVENAI